MRRFLKKVLNRGGDDGAPSGAHRPTPIGDQEGVDPVPDDVVMLSDPTGARAEAVRALGARVIAQHFREGRRALAVCGASLDVGCSFVAANLSVALSQRGVKTLLIDGDLRNPTIDRFIPPPGAQDGLRRCLASSHPDFRAHIQAEVLPGLAVIYGGDKASAEPHLGGDRFRALMEFALREFDATIVDTPPANSSSDARQISAVVGYSMVVARTNLSLVDDVKLLLRELELDRSRVVGTALFEA